MGYYINPEDGRPKERWLQDEGRRASLEECRHCFAATTERPVCLVDNGAFTAAGIAYSPEELEAFAAPDRRPKRWFLVPTERLRPFCPCL